MHLTGGEKTSIKMKHDPGIPVTASFGVSDLSRGASSIDEILTQADRALYKAWKSGRKRVVR